jgi:hypothetical protein
VIRGSKWGQVVVSAALEQADRVVIDGTYDELG